MNLIPFQNLVSGNHAKITNYAILSLDLFKVTSNSSIEWQHNKLQVSRVGVYSLCIERVPLRIFSLISLNILLRLESIPMRLLVRGLFFTNKLIYSIYYGSRSDNMFKVMRFFLKRVIMWQKLLRFDRLCGVIY